MPISTTPGDDAAEASAQAERDEQCVAAIVRSQAPLAAFLRSLIRSQSDLDDVLQETNLVLWRKRETYDPTRSFMSWACKIAHLQALAHFKKSGRRNHQALNESLLSDVAMLAAREAEQFDQKRDLLRRCIEKLSDKQKRLLKTRYQKGVAVKDLAESLGRTPDSLGMLLFRIRSLLRSCIERNSEMGAAT